MARHPMIKPKEKLLGLNPAFSATLTGIAIKLPFDLIITEGVPATTVGSHVKDSAHFRGLAADLRHEGDILKAMRIAYWLGRLNVVRVGFYDRHIHADVDPKLPQTQWEGKSA